LPECKESLSGQLEKNTDEFVDIYSNGENIKINKKYIAVIKTKPANESWKKMLLECLLFWLGIWFAIFLIIIICLIPVTKSPLYAFLCALGISLIDLIFIIIYSDVEADLRTSRSWNLSTKK
jgi:hypothetical protein